MDGTGRAYAKRKGYKLARRSAMVRRLCPNSTGADIRSVCTEAGMFAIRARRKTVTEKDFLDAVQKVRDTRHTLNGTTLPPLPDAAFAWHKMLNTWSMDRDC